MCFQRRFKVDLGSQLRCPFRYSSTLDLDFQSTRTTEKCSLGRLALKTFFQQSGTLLCSFHNVVATELVDRETNALGAHDSKGMNRNARDSAHQLCTHSPSISEFTPRSSRSDLHIGQLALGPFPQRATSSPRGVLRFSMPHTSTGNVCGHSRRRRNPTLSNVRSALPRKPISGSVLVVHSQLRTCSVRVVAGATSIAHCDGGRQDLSGDLFLSERCSGLHSTLRGPQLQPTRVFLWLEYLSVAFGT